MIHRRSPAVWVFGVDEDAVQLTWRNLGSAPLVLRVLTDDVDAEAVVDEPGSSGAGRTWRRCGPESP